MHRHRDATPPWCNAQLLELHGGLCERMVEALATKTGEALASQLGSELLRVSPFFSMYVSYCAHFMRANELLEQVLATRCSSSFAACVPRKHEQ
jgi:hypothetical protein